MGEARPNTPMFEFAIRDADTNYHTDPEELDRVWGRYDLPVSLAVVPKHGPTRSPAVPEDYWYDRDPDERFPLADNEALVEYLRDGVEADRYSVLQHGYDHVRTPAGPEFARHGDLQERLVDGREHLESTLDVDVDVFVPPDGALSSAGSRALERERMRTLHYLTLRGRTRSPAVVRTFAADALFKYRHRTGGRLTFLQDLYRLWAIGDRSVGLASRPEPYRVDGGWEFTAVSLVESAGLARVKRQLRLADALEGKFCLALHYHDFRSERFREQFEELLRYARTELDPKFVHCEALFRG
ncbi:DUF2334 domain-containing protein [Salinirubellus salinus]|uniref:DUF2334 domain-containing protein n=1 Tax=Salinirubellus salinus TaxID=1364945 RepID=A0A9E7U6D6_9EURY|nr:DUF2334 domain-containing protein [Salinirubellus salinus]UWM56370.1 DUF2334 domain-containing protein [Salinirubellus salinus]